MSDVQLHTYDFGDFRIDTGRRLLLRAGEHVPLTPKVFDTLILLIAHQGQVLDKQHIMSAIWPDTVVEENNLNQNISALRRIFSETRGENRFIATVPGKGLLLPRLKFVPPCLLPPELATHTFESASSRSITSTPDKNASTSPTVPYRRDHRHHWDQIDPDHFSVIGRTSVMSYKRTTKSLVEIGRELDASYLIESSLDTRRRPPPHYLKAHPSSRSASDMVWFLREPTSQSPYLPVRAQYRYRRTDSASASLPSASARSPTARPRTPTPMTSTSEAASSGTSSPLSPRVAPSSTLPKLPLSTLPMLSPGPVSPTLSVPVLSPATLPPSSSSPVPALPPTTPFAPIRLSLKRRPH